MFRHIFLYNLKTLLRSKEVVFWTLLYPIALSTFFFLAFNNLSSIENFSKINIAVVKSAQTESGTPFYMALDSVSNIEGTAGKNDLFNAKLTDEKTAKNLLDNGSISGYIYYDDTLNLAVTGSGFSQTITKAFLNSYLQTSSSVTQILSQNPKAYYDGLLTDLSANKEYLSEVKINNPDTTVIYFYTLLAMTCLFAATVGVQEVIKIQANLSSLAARINLSPVHKLKTFLYSFASAAVFQFILTLVVLAFIIFVLGISFGSKVGYVILTCAVGSITGLFFGTFVSALIKKGEGIKYAIVISLTMFSCFLAGMMSSGVKYAIQQSAPIVGYLNPVNLITDAFYSLYYYDSLTRYFENIAILCAFSVVFFLGTYLVLRRQKYASI